MPSHLNQASRAFVMSLVTMSPLAACAAAQEVAIAPGVPTAPAAAPESSAAEFQAPTAAPTPMIEANPARPASHSSPRAASAAAASAVRSSGTAPMVSEVLGSLEPDARIWYQHVQTLSNPYFEGRAPGTEGIKRAAAYIEHYYTLAGLEPAFDSDGNITTWESFRQPFDFRAPSKTATIHSASLSTPNGPIDTRDWVVFGVSGSGNVTAPLTFVGYGIEDGPDEYSSFDDDSDLTGRIAVLMRYEPLDEAGESRWTDARFTRHAGLSGKISAVAKRNPAAILFVNPPGLATPPARLESMLNSGRFGDRRDFPLIQVTTEQADAIIRQADNQGRSLMDLRTMADTGQVTTLDLDDRYTLNMAVDLEAIDRLATENVGAVLRGKGDLADEWLVVGAHYDHVGYGYTGARPANVGTLHPGADDNASGTAALLVLAKRLSDAYAEASEDASLRSVLFIAFSAEEAGLHGSRYYVQNATLDAGEIDMMLNLDMVGRLRNNELTVMGTGTAQEFDEMLDEYFEAGDFDVNKSPGGRGPSDHASFYAAGIPVLFFFTQTHDVYHQPGDEAWTVDPVGAGRIINMAEDVLMDVAAEPRRLTFVENAGGGSPTRRMNTSVRLGIMMDYGAELDTGILIEDVFPDTSASKAGIEAGDIILRWDSEPIEGGQGLLGFLRDAKPGDKVNFTIIRDGKEMTLPCTLQARE